MEVQTIWKRINEQIKAQNTTQRALALQCGFTERRIESLSSTNRLPDAIEITLIAKALNTTVEFLVTGENSTPKPDTTKIIQTIESALEQAKNL